MNQLGQWVCGSVGLCFLPRKAAAGGARRYILGTPRETLRRFERELLGEDWRAIRDGLEVKLRTAPDGDETFILCRSADRGEKEKAMHDRFEKRIEEGLQKIEESCTKRKHNPVVIAERLGKPLARKQFFRPESS